MLGLLFILLAASAAVVWLFSHIDQAQGKKEQEKKAEEFVKPMGCFCNNRISGKEINDELNQNYFNLVYTKLDDYPEFAHDLDELKASKTPTQLKDEVEAKKNDLSEEEQNQFGSYLMTNNGEVLDALDLVKARADQPESKPI